MNVKIQLHWQNRDNPSDAILVAQLSIADYHDEKNYTKDELHWQDLLTELIWRRRGEAPDGFEPVVCCHRYHLFIQGKEDGEF